jgi:GxxExxY protein
MSQICADERQAFGIDNLSLLSANICAICGKTGFTPMSKFDELQQRDPQTYAIIGACMAVHNELGPGFLEAVYQEALAIEFTQRGIQFVRERPMTITYAGQQLATRYDADFLCYDSVILETKAVRELIPAHEAQTIHYLKATRSERGLLVNFGSPRLQYKRFVFSRSTEEFATDSAD